MTAGKLEGHQVLLQHQTASQPARCEHAILKLQLFVKQPIRHQVGSAELTDANDASTVAKSQESCQK